MVPASDEGGGSVPGSPAFMSELTEYRRALLAAFMDLTGGLLQYLKDCFCHHLLVDCPTCRPEDEVYLASVMVRGGEVYKICNFSRRKYVKSFPTVDYWLSLIPVAPFVRKAVEMLCCLVLPDLFGRFEQREKAGYKPRMSSKQLLSGVVAFRKMDLKAELQKQMSQVKMAQKVMGDWAVNAMTQTAEPASKGAVAKDDVLDRPVEDVLKRAEEAQLKVAVAPYEPGRAAGNLRRIARAPVNIPAGSEITLYEQDGVVRYYSLTERPSEPVEALRTELETQKEALTQMEALKADLDRMQGLLTVKDQELGAVRGQLQVLEAKHDQLAAAPELARVAHMETELKSLKAFQKEVKRFMKK
jgi:hypothetical protein